jgi:hypothetical protein
MKRLPPLDQRQLDQIKFCASRGLRWEDIARIVGRAEASIQRDKKAMAMYRQGRADVKLLVGNSLVKMATNGRSAAATIFAAKVMLGFTEDGGAFRESSDAMKTIKIPGAHFGKVSSSG